MGRGSCVSRRWTRADAEETHSGGTVAFGHLDSSSGDRSQNLYRETSSVWRGGQEPPIPWLSRLQSAQIVRVHGHPDDHSPPRYWHIPNKPPVSSARPNRTVHD